MLALIIYRILVTSIKETLLDLVAITSIDLIQSHTSLMRLYEIKLLLHHIHYIMLKKI